MKFLKFLMNDFLSESRDKKEVNLVKIMGNNVHVLCGNAKASLNLENIDTDVCYFYKDFSLIHNKIVRWSQIINYDLKLARYIKKENADILSCHDISALAIGYWSNLFKRHKAKLVYDSHEFEIGRNADRSKFRIWLIKHLERFLIKRCAFTIVVNDSIADELVKLHKLKQRPVVVRNIPYYWKLNQNEISKTRKMFLDQLKMPEDTFLMMYHGGVSENRGIENCIVSLSKLDNTCLVILGNGEMEYKNTLIDLCKQENVLNRVLFLDAVPEDELYKYVGAVDVGMINIIAKYKSYYFALPNKFFQNIQSLTPVIVSDFPEMGKLVDKYDIGLKINPESVDEIVDSINKMKNDKQLYSKFKNNLKLAKEDLCFEKEESILKKAYCEIIRQQSDKNEKEI